MFLPHMPEEFWTEEARVALRDEHFEKCITACKKAIAFRPINPTVYLYMGDANRSLGKRMQRLRIRGLDTPYYSAAMEAYREGLKLFPQDAVFFLHMAQTFDGLKIYEEADASFKRATELDPKLEAIHASYALFLHKLGRFKEAGDQYKKAGNEWRADQEYKKTRGISRDPPAATLPASP
jgi:tetratricopeptide (TPR) repeat protein